MESVGSSSTGPLPLSPPSPPIRIVRDAILAFVVAIALTFGLVVAILIAGLISGGFRFDSSNFSPAMWVVLLLATEIPFATVAVFLRWRYQRTGRLLPALFEGPYKRAIPVGIVAGAVMAGFGVLHALLAAAVFGKASTEAMEDLLRAVMSAQENPGVAAALVASIAVLAPVCEEFFFRGAIFSSVRSSGNSRAAALISSALFAIAHMNPMMFTYYFVFGLTMCWLFSRTRTMATPIVAHMTVNATAAIAMLMGSAAK